MTQRPTNDNEPTFLRLQAELAQALSGRAEIKVTVGLNRIADEPLSNRELILIAKLLDATPDVATRHMRGQVDLAALALKYHNAHTHETQRPADAQAAAMFDALEIVRLEAVAGNQFHGIRHNLAQRHQTAFMLKGYDAKTTPSDGLNTSLPDVVAMLAREAMTGEKPPPAIESLVAQMRPWVIKTSKVHLKKLKNAAKNQKLFAHIVQEILFDLKLVTHRPGNVEGGDGESGESADVMGHASDEADDQNMQTDATQSLQSAGDAADNEHGERREVKAPGDFDSDAEQEVSPKEKAPRAAPNRAEFMEQMAKNYRAFTTKFDEIIPANELASAEELDRLFETLMQKVKQYHTVTSRLATRLQRLLMAQQTRQWMYEQEEIGRAHV